MIVLINQEKTLITELNSLDTFPIKTQKGIFVVITYRLTFVDSKEEI